MSVPKTESDFTMCNIFVDPGTTFQSIPINQSIRFEGQVNSLC